MAEGNIVAVEQESGGLASILGWPLPTSLALLPPDFSISTARLTLTFAPPRSSSAGELFSGCPSNRTVSRAHPYFVVITLGHPIAPRLSKATSRVGPAAAAVINAAIPTAAAAIAAMTNAPRSDRHSPRDSENSMQEVSEA